IVVHEFEDPDAPPSSLPRSERWESDRHPVGSGGQGQVFIQRLQHAGTTSRPLRAVKFITLGDGTGKKVHRYRRELETNFRFSHPKYSKHFVRSLGWYLSKDSTSLCITMEYLSKGDLQTYIINNPLLSEDECCEIAYQVFKGLRIMHREGFAHRDVKPANVLIQRCPTGDAPGSWWVKLTDFGISKPFEELATGNTTLAGTPGYLAPEIIRPADMWSLGVLMYRILAGRDPFLGLSDVLRYCNNHTASFPSIPLASRKISTESQRFNIDLLHPLVAGRQRAVGHVWFERFAKRPSLTAVAPTR
ncbi:kinase-like domain-containing protein, partial [Coniochaeta sp. 2T2.1]